MEKVTSIRIYTEHRGNDVDYGVIAGFVAGLLPRSRVESRPPLLDAALESKNPDQRESLLESLADAFARAKVRDLSRPVKGDQAVLPGEVDYERRRLADRGKTVFGLLYDAYLLSSLFGRFMDRDESAIDCVNIVFTNQLIGTWDETDHRYHARAILCGSPAVLSLSGLVAAPAKSREYYLARQGATAVGLPDEEARRIADSFADGCLEYNDTRMTEIAKGYAMQAIAYRVTGEPFCGDPQCRLYNAHRQAELLEAQLGGNEFCEKHRALFEAAKDDA